MNLNQDDANFLAGIEVGVRCHENGMNLQAALAYGGKVICTDIAQCKLLPIPSDLSVNSLRLALEIGGNNGLGQPLMLVVGEEIYDTACKVLEIQSKERKIQLRLESKHVPIEDFSSHSWYIVFARGSVESRMPSL